MREKRVQKTSVIDAKGLILGRMASLVAKRLLIGEQLIIINAEEIVISGKRTSLIKEAKRFLEVGHFRKGPFHPRKPDTILKRAVRGMLPKKKPRGRKALKGLKVYNGTPKEYEKIERENIPEAESLDLRGPFITLSELAKNIGWNR